MNSGTGLISRPALVQLLIGAVLMLGLLGLFVIVAGNASAGGDAKVTVNTTANIHDGDDDTGDCDTSPDSGTCSLGQAINTVNAGDADIINFHPPVFSKSTPGVINLCTGDGELPAIEEDVVILSKDTGVILDGSSKDDEDCDTEPPSVGLFAEAFGNGFDFELNGGKNFEIRNIDGEGILICGGPCDGGQSLGTIEITGVTIENVEDDGIVIVGSNLESGSITNSEISSNFGNGIGVYIDSCEGNGCVLTDSVLDISGNRIEGGVDAESSGAVAGETCCVQSGVDIEYIGTLNIDPDDVFAGVIIGGGTKITASISQNEVINGTGEGVTFDFFGCGQDAGVNVHVDENEQINAGFWDGVDVSIFADSCSKASGAVAGGIDVDLGNTSDGFHGVVTVNGNGDIESEGNDGPLGEAVSVTIDICCEQSDSSASVEVNDNGRLTGEDDGVGIRTEVCCGDDNTSDVNVNNNDEITGEDDDGIDVQSFAGSSSDASFISGAVAGQPSTGFDADDNVCTITVDGNNEVDGVGGHAMELECFAGTFGTAGDFDLPIVGIVAGAPLSSGDENVASIVVSNNNDIDGDEDGVNALSAAGSTDGEGDDNLATVSVMDNGEITGDDGDGVDATVAAGSQADEGDDNSTEIVITGNEELGGNGGDGLNLNSLSGGITPGSEDNSTSVLVDGNGDIEGQDESGDGINVESLVCCDEANLNFITITNNTGEITGHDGDGIDIGGFDAFGLDFDGLCCSANFITISDNTGNIRGGDDHGLKVEVCVTDTPSDFPPFAPFGDGQRVPLGFPAEDCMSHSVTQLTVINNSFSDSEKDGINICCGGFQLAEFGIKSIISNNVIEGNGDDGIDIESSIGLNIGPGNEIFENGTSDGDNGVEIDWYLGGCIWFAAAAKVPANSNTITQNSIHDNSGLGIDLVGFDADGTTFFDSMCAAPDTGGVEEEGVVGCVPFTATAISPNNCIGFPDLQTQSGDKLVGTACSECTVEVFWADDGEGAEYIVSGEANIDGDFSIDLPCDLESGDFTATATDKLKNTSEFSETLVTLGTGPCVTDTPIPPDETDTPVPPDETATPEPTKTCGDVNMDGNVNSVDATLILQLKAGLISSLANESSADVNNSGSITSVDASLILQATAGLIDEGALTCP